MLEMQTSEVIFLDRISDESEHQINNTTYQVKSKFRESEQAQSLEAQISRLILSCFDDTAPA